MTTIVARDCDHIFKGVNTMIMDVSGPRRDWKLAEAFAPEVVQRALRVDQATLQVLQVFVKHDHCGGPAGVADIGGWAGLLLAGQEVTASRVQQQLQQGAAGAQAASAPQKPPGTRTDELRLLVALCGEQLERSKRELVAAEVTRRKLSTAGDLWLNLVDRYHDPLHRQQPCYNPSTGELYAYEGGPRLLVDSLEITQAHRVGIHGPVLSLNLAAGGSQEKLHETVLQFGRLGIVEVPCASGSLDGHCTWELTPSGPEAGDLLQIPGALAPMEELLESLGRPLSWLQLLALFARGGLDGTGPGASLDFVVVVKVRRARARARGTHRLASPRVSHLSSAVQCAHALRFDSVP